MGILVVAMAFAPGHVTGLFVPDLEGPDPRSRGSRGAGIVLDVGARARVELRELRADATRIEVLQGGLPVSFPITELALRLLVPSHGYTVRVELRHELPVSHGFGMSAAGTLASAMALAQCLGLPVERAHEAAHRAEMELHGGLGGVSAILGGGLEVRRVAGVPPYGKVERTPHSRGFFAAFLRDPLPSPPLLGNPEFLARVAALGTPLLGDLPPPPVPWTRFFEASLEFSRGLALGGSALTATLGRVTESGVPAFQAMMGNTLVASPPDEDSEGRLVTLLRRAGFTILRVHVGRTGAIPLGPDTADAS